MYEKINEICKNFEPLSLEKADGMRLFNRNDTKFILKFELLPEILGLLEDKYFILEIENKRLLDYHTLYYDTSDKKMYHLHHNGKLNRYKIRQREYLVSGTTFLEIKFKNNKEHTIKKRILREKFNSELQIKDNEFIKKNTPYSIENLQPAVTNFFTRITLINKTEKERITIDYNLKFQTETKKQKILNLVVAEVKREEPSCCSDFVKLLKSKKIYPSGMSKYCIGTVLTDNSVKKNIFKRKLLSINKLQK
ncbi:MAG: polyphosphate polymerase domain-containing protein [Bacteroidales bacterium]|nr:polyphosphate polymerase domain-containing protein [Bacteroidales bacterium]